MKAACDFMLLPITINLGKAEFQACNDNPHSPPPSAGNSILHSAADSVTSAVQKASQALNERGERLGRAEDRTADMMNSAEQFAVTAHKVSSGAGHAPVSIHDQRARCCVQGSDGGNMPPPLHVQHLVIIGAAKRSNICLKTLSAVCPLCSLEIMFLFFPPHLLSFVVFCCIRLSVCHLSVLPVCIENCTQFNEAASIMTSKCNNGGSESI